MESDLHAPINTINQRSPPSLESPAVREEQVNSTVDLDQTGKTYDEAPNPSRVSVVSVEEINLPEPNRDGNRSIGSPPLRPLNSEQPSSNQSELGLHRLPNSEEIEPASRASEVHRVPEIPPNTGNIIRLCANSGAQLHLIEPLGFELDDKRMRRAGLDYGEWAEVKRYQNFETFLANPEINKERIFACTTKTKQSHFGSRQLCD